MDIIDAIRDRRTSGRAPARSRARPYHESIEESVRTDPNPVRAEEDLTALEAAVPRERDARYCVRWIESGVPA